MSSYLMLETPASFQMNVCQAYSTKEMKWTEMMTFYTILRCIDSQIDPGAR